MTFVIFDTEYTSWQGCQEHGWKGKQKKEVVQIAALKVNDDWKILGEFNVFCRPLFNPVLSDYFVNLTKITNEKIRDCGVPFAQAYADFKEFVGDGFCLSHGWGGDYYEPSDGSILKENLDLYNILENNPLVYRNAAAIFQALYQKHTLPIKNQSSGQIASLLNLENKLLNLGINQHNALYDVYSILVGLKYFKADIMEISPLKFVLRQ